MPAAFSAVGAGAQIKAIGSHQVIFDFQMLANKNITKVEDLVGKRFAAGPPLSIQTEVPRVIMRKYGVDPDKVQFQQAGGTPERLQAVVGGIADAALIGTSFALQAVAKYPNVHVLTTVPKEFPGMGFSYIMATSKALSDPAKKKAMEAYVEQSAIRGSRFVMDNPQEAVQILLQAGAVARSGNRQAVGRRSQSRQGVGHQWRCRSRRDRLHHQVHARFQDGADARHL